MREDISRRAFLCGVAALASAPAAASLPDLGFLSAPPAVDEAEVQIIRVVSEVMTPAFHKGEHVWFWPRKGPRAGDDTVIEMRGEQGPAFYLYRLVGWDEETVTLRQFNPVRDHVFPRSAVVNAGRVVRTKDLM